MPSKKGQGGPAWQIILEDIQSQNRATIEALSATRVEIKQDIAELATETRSRLALLEAAVARLARETAERDASLEQAIRVLRGDTEIALREVSVSLDQNSLDIRGLTARIAALEERVAALERSRAN
ncbi:MAG: hypothetical protein AB7O37_18045 [Vicinamibacteria bacterium]